MIVVPPTIGFERNESRLREGGTVNVCLTVTRGEITNPTSVVLATNPFLIPNDGGNFPGDDGTPPGEGGNFLGDGGGFFPAIRKFCTIIVLLLYMLPHMLVYPACLDTVPKP